MRALPYGPWKRFEEDFGVGFLTGAALCLLFKRPAISGHNENLSSSTRHFRGKRCLH